MNKFFSELFIFVILLAGASCSRKNEPVTFTQVVPQIELSEKNHKWFYFDDDEFFQTPRPQEAPLKEFRPWTECVRISSAASLPVAQTSAPYAGFAVVNRAGMLALKEGGAELFGDVSIFSNDTAESLVFSDGVPVFYLYRSTFFNDRLNDNSNVVQSSRSFLVEFNPNSCLCYPLVTYESLNLLPTDQISGYFWDGKTWACAAKRMLDEDDKVQFTYFYWEPVVSLTDLNPMFTKDMFTFRTSSEEEYTALNMPRLFDQAPAPLVSLLRQIPVELTLYVSWRDSSGTSPVSYYQGGNGSVPLNAHAALVPLSGITVAVFADGTTYIQRTGQKEIAAFRLPLLPGGFVYGDFAVAGKSLYVAWEETSFFKTGRAGFLQVDLGDILSRAVWK